MFACKTTSAHEKKDFEPFVAFCHQEQEFLLESQRTCVHQQNKT